MSYDYPAFLEAVRRQRRTAPTGCFYCDVVLPTTAGPAVVRAQQERCVAVSGFVVDAHHVIPKQLLKREFPHGVMRSADALVAWDPRFVVEWLGDGPAPSLGLTSLDDLLMDARNGVLLRRYCHDLIEVGSRRIPMVHMPEETLEFAGELGLGWYLDKMEDRRT